jgi:hypothetical protein
MPFIFVVGNSRSGTTMMGRILSNHELVHTFPELHFFEQMWSPSDELKILNETEALRVSTRLLNISSAGYFAKKEPQKYANEAREIISRIHDKELTSLRIFSDVIIHEAKRNGKEYPCDQTPQNVFYIKEILNAYRDSYLINIVRDPRDVLLSQKRKWKRRFLGGSHATWYETIRAWTNYHPLTISKLWNSAIRAGEAIKDNRVMTVQFESLLKDPDVTIQSICSFLNISFSTNLKQVPHMGSSSGMDKRDVKGINSERAQSWEKGGLHNSEIWICQKTCGRYMKRFGYKDVKTSANPFYIIFYYLIFPIKLGFAFLLNLHRMKNILETVKKRMR